VRTGPTTVPDDGPRTRAPLRWVPRLTDARIRSKLAFILVVPVAAVIALATVRLADLGQGAYDARMVHSLAALSLDVSGLAQDIHKERMGAATFLASADPKPDAYNAYARRTDQRAAKYAGERARIGTVPAAVERQLNDIDDHLSTLNSTRREVLDRQQMPVPEAVLRYGVILADLVSYGEILGQVSGEGAVPDSLRAVSAFARAKAATAEQEAAVFVALSAGSLDEEQFASYLATLTGQQEALLAFSLAGSAWERDLVNTSVTGDAVLLADQVTMEITRSVGQPASIGATEAAQSIGAVNDLMRWAQIQMETRLLDRASAGSSDVTRQAVTESVLVLVALLVAVVLTAVLARSLNNSLRELREGALAVANRHLPDAVAKLRDVNDLNAGGPEDIVRNLRDPIQLPTRDEIGQVGQAFNVVHREAVRIAAEQAALRASVSAMFLSLARRSQTLVDRMIGELDTIERGEEDPRRLAQLFELDHLATRMRRNDENLLVLAGADSTPPRREDALLVDTLRAAQSEVELYHRIEFGTIDSDISIAAHTVNDVVRLVAELLDNATRFSPPNTTVVADARRLRDYALIHIEDRGIGLSAEQVDNLNRRLAEPSAVDVSAFRLMGLAVVSRLASRYGIQVELRPNVEGGTVAQVTLPSNILVLARRDQPVSRPHQPLAVEPAPMSASGAGDGWPAAAPDLSNRPITHTDQWRSGGSQWNVVPDPGTAAGAMSLGTPTVASPSARPATLRGYAEDRVTPAAHPMAPIIRSNASMPQGPVAGQPAATVPRPEDATEMPIFREMEEVWFQAHSGASAGTSAGPTAGHASPASGPGRPAVSAPPVVASRFSAAGRPSGAAFGMTFVADTSDGVPPRPVPHAWEPGQSGPAACASPAPPASASLTTAPHAPTSGQHPITPTAATSGGSSTIPRQRGGGNVWRTAADEGWARASQAAQPATAGITRSGLPKRRPQAQLVPGGVETRTSRERTRRTPDDVRGLLSAYHRGVQRGRRAASEPDGATSPKETNR